MRRGQGRQVVASGRKGKKERKKWATAPFKDIHRPFGITPQSILTSGVRGRGLVAGMRRDTPGKIQPSAEKADHLTPDEVVTDPMPSRTVVRSTDVRPGQELSSRSTDLRTG